MSVVSAVGMIPPLVRGPDENDLLLALEIRLAFLDAMLWASAQRAGVRHIVIEDFQNGFVLRDITFINPFNPKNNPLIDKLLPHS